MIHSSSGGAAEDRPRLSIVAPCFNEEETLGEFHRRAKAAALAAVNGDFEIVLVDDGSTDRSWQLISEVAAQGSCVVGARLRRNYGQQMAVMAGLQAARGDRVLLIDADLQDPPELIGDMMRLMDEGAEVVYGKRAQRAGETLFKRATSVLVYRVLRALSSIDIPVDSGDFRLMSRRVVDIFLSMPEQHRYTRGLVSWIGGSQVAISYAADARFAGETKYTLSKIVRFAIDALTSFSIKPLRLATWIGFFTAFGALCLMVYSSLRWAMGEVVDGWTSLMMTMAAFSAVQLMVLGILGEYVGRLVLQSKHRRCELADRYRHLLAAGHCRRRRAVACPCRRVHGWRAEQLHHERDDHFRPVDGGHRQSPADLAVRSHDPRAVPARNRRLLDRSARVAVALCRQVRVHRPDDDPDVSPSRPGLPEAWLMADLSRFAGARGGTS